MGGRGVGQWQGQAWHGWGGQAGQSVGTRGSEKYKSSSETTQRILPGVSTTDICSDKRPVSLRAPLLPQHARGGGLLPGSLCGYLPWAPEALTSVLLGARGLFYFILCHFGCCPVGVFSYKSDLSICKSATKLESGSAEQVAFRLLYWFVSPPAFMY